MRRTLSKFDGLLLHLALWTATSPVGTAQVAEREPADDAMRRALGSALQADGRAAVTALRAVDTAGLSSRYAPTRACMLQRLDERKLPSATPADPSSPEF